MPLRINEITSNVDVTGGEVSLSNAQIDQIVRIVLEKIDEKQAHQARVSEESMIRDQASEIEPY